MFSFKGINNLLYSTIKKTYKKDGIYRLSCLMSVQISLENLYRSNLVYNLFAFFA